MPHPSRPSPLPIVFFTVFLDLLGVGILIPIVPQLLGNPASEFYLLPAGWTLEQGYVLLGLLVTSYPLMQFVATPILGQLSDKFGRKPVLLFSLMGTSASYVLFAIGILLQNLPLLFFSRAIDGVTGGNISVAQAAISDTTKPEHRARAFGLIGAAFGLGFIMGPYIGGKLSDPSIAPWFHAATPFWFAALLAFGNVLFVTFRFPETLANPEPARRINWRRSAQNINRAWGLRPLRSIFITTFLLHSGFAFFTTFFGVFLIDKFGFTQGNIGDFFSFMGLWIVFGQAVVVRRVSRVYAEPQVLRISLIGSGVCLLLYQLPTVWWGLFLIAPFFAAFNGLTQANLSGLLSRSASPRIQGEIFGINASVQALAQSIPPFLSGFIASAASVNAPLYVSAALIIAAGLLFTALFEPVKEPVG